MRTTWGRVAAVVVLALVIARLAYIPGERRVGDQFDDRGCSAPAGYQPAPFG